MAHKALPESAIHLLLQNPFSTRASELDAAVAELNGWTPGELERKSPDEPARRRAVLALLHARALNGALDHSDLTHKKDHTALLRIALASARCSTRLRQLAGTSQALARVRSEVWSACFGKTLVHASELAALIRGHDVLIIGETGVGKEELAHAIALGTLPNSGVNAAPFAALNVAAVPETLVEAELFGHVKGAFTGAHAARTGVVRSADGGCLLLDEVGDLPLATQAKLLRVIETDRVQPLGTEQVHAVDVRFVSATHHDLATRVAQGSFRGDLYQRVGALVIRVPPLRERREDIPFLAKHFLQKCARELGVEAKRLAETTVKYLGAQEFPGNVRQLENLCHWLTVMSPSVTIEIKDLPPETRTDAAMPASAGWIPLLEKEVETLLNRGDMAIMEELARSFERALIAKALAHTGGRRIEASQLLGLGRNTLTRKIQELGLDGNKDRNGA